ncbi:TetR family transcriptional regulator [Amycolatopsis sp. YIM 10]|uniref:TetR/AcrR family transcriptional regulator n=1 Tax=Amycolatopsis sp. YIM 10 TaxID=2653857 RepID=UPI00129045D8|nr:TetR family transcriptional regulator [Amycolatopsis sp. YIM 10]
MNETARRSDRTKEVILAAARERFAKDGYERATIRAIAADARIDPSMVMRYYGNKERLFAAAAEFDLQLPALTEVPRAEVGKALIAHFLDRWENDDTLKLLLRSGATNPAAAERMQQIFASQLLPVIIMLEPPDNQFAARAGLIASQVLGLALCRYVLALPPVVDMDRAAIIAWVGPVLRRYLVERA